MSLFLGSCQPAPTGQPIPTEQPTNQNTQNNAVENIRVTTVQPSETLVKTETFPLPNCGGTGEIRQTLGSTASITKSVTLSGKATIRGGGEAGIPETVKLKLEIEIEAAYQKAYESANSRLDTIDMPAAAGTHVVYDIGWYEQVFNSIVQYSIDGQVYEAPYTYKLQVPKLDNSRQISCGTNTVIANTPTLPESTSTSAVVEPQQNSGLAIGEWYTKGNISFIIDEVDYYSGSAYSYVELSFNVKNVGSSQISFEYSSFNFKVTDNLGQDYPIHTPSRGNSTMTIKPGAIKRLPPPVVWEFKGNYANPQVEYLIVTITDISSIEKAEWIIPVSH